ncbi:transcriptional regulator levR [Klebsiella variicola]|nr:transcriptional regulator levR [Klebsiella variicola]SLW36608.1 transcriptional regulator levR [Klebsiella variicola]SLZ77725.1 transcriptional regulator levR [Klebsiella variicola]SLZ95510.1 transcriptional regulator levR [Klebsiella variicola]SMA05420.1 transcriptional regulator levR [Klebsiella variicola]
MMGDAMRKTELLAFLQNQTDFFDPDNLSEVFTAGYLARRFAMQRNTASHYLNQLVAQDVLVKINTRPVYFLHKAAFCQQFFPLSRSEYASMAELLAESDRQPEQADHFSLLTGHDGSLRKPIEQMKTALFYPNGGLPLLIVGDSGTGKSYMAELMHEFAIAQGLLPPDAPFVSFNCAQYASNPELLAANLFGYVKGAFTGAQSDKAGAFEAANGGVLFLDEVHRLDAQGQEKLFTWLDRKEIYRVGETAQGMPISLRLVFATTEDIHSTFLTTFIRRIPILVSLPDLQTRSRHEKDALTLQFFWQEARTLATRLQLTPRLLQVLTHYVYRGNVGELKNVVKYAVASAWARCPGSEMLTVTLHDLPENIMAATPALSEAMGQQEPLLIEPQTSLVWLLRARDPIQGLIYDTQCRVLALYEAVQSKKTLWDEAQKSMGEEIETLFDRLIFDNHDANSSHMLLLITHQVREEFYRLEKRFNIQFNGNCIYALSHYLIHRSRQGPSTMSNEKSRLLEDFLAQKYPLLYRFCEEILAALALKLDIEPRRIDLLLLVLWLHKNGAISQQQVTRAIILAHGYATASSIANVANRLLKSQLFESFDMPLDVTPEAIANQVMAWIESHALASGLIILVDMGSLNAIHRHFNRRLSTPMAIINNVSTGMAMYVGERILQGVMLEDIVRDIGDDLAVEHQLYYPQTDKPRAILTTCATGLGAAANLSALLKASIPEALGIDIVACDVETLADPARRQPMLSRYEVLAIVGTLDPQLADLPWISLDSLISGQGSRPLMRIFGELTSSEQVSEINNLILKNFSLRRVIESVTILDTAKVINQVEQFLLRYEHLAGCDVPNDRKVALYVHISCLIERLIRNASPSHYSGRQCPQSELATLREAFSVIESGYSVKIPVVELCYIHDILTRETEFIQEDQEF